MIQELEDPPRRGLSVTVTFDDGYRGTFTEAFPVLREYSIPATVYLLAGAVENNTIAWYDRIFLALQQTTKETFTVTLGRRKEYTLSSPATREQAATVIITHLRSVPDEERRRWCAEFDAEYNIPQEDLKDHMMTWGQVRIMQQNGITFGAHT